MKEFKTITEYQILYLTYHSLLERISHEEEINERTKKKKAAEIIEFAKVA